MLGAEAPADARTEVLRAGGVALDVHVRRAIGTLGPVSIATVRGIGYRFRC